MKKIFTIAVLLMASIASVSAQDEFEYKEGDTTYIMKKYYMVLLLANPDKERLDSAMVAQIQQAHLDNISRLAKEGKIVMAGPMGDNGNLRGIFVMDCRSQAEADSLVQTDPAISQKRLMAEIHPWWAAKGSKLP
ncbi:MAG: hypothetical protein HC819_09830 [Cyclobacteriaceae bacterium]|nr:hypothetical protein [Cyclobacteriaceae bacterium]